MVRLSTLGGALLAPLPLFEVVAAATAHSGRFPRAKRGNGFLSVPVGTVEKSRRSIERRDDGEAESMQTILENRGYFYATELEIGEPPQTVTVLVDTGSSELWVNPDCSTAPSAHQAEQCRDFGHYDPENSDTPPIRLEEGKVRYGDLSDPTTRTSIDVRYYADTISFGDAVITNQTFGVVTASEGQSQGILGLAPDLDDGFGEEPYSMVLNSMYEQGVISSRVFSLDLRHSESASGALIYGGMDRSKFIGKMERLDVIKGRQGEYRLAVELDTLGVSPTEDGPDSTNNYKLRGDDRNVLLDSGTTISRMHWEAASPILEALDAVRNDGETYFQVSCDKREAAGSVDFGFGNKTLRVPFRDFIIDAGGEDSGGGTTWCAVGLAITTDQQIIGDSVLRAGYFVFDWDNKAVHVAQAADCGDEDIIAIDEDGVPEGVTGRCSDEDVHFTGGIVEPTGPRPEWPPSTGPYTITYTITTCPPFERACETGVVTTETYGSAEPTQTTRTSSDETDRDAGDGNGDDENSGSRIPTSAWAVLAITGITAVHNAL